MRKVKLKYKHYLFDWGDTLMVDFPNENVPMYLWENVAAVEGALEVLKNPRKKIIAIWQQMLKISIRFIFKKL